VLLPKQTLGEVEEVKLMLRTIFAGLKDLERNHAYLGRRDSAYITIFI